MSLIKCGLLSISVSLLFSCKHQRQGVSSTKSITVDDIGKNAVSVSVEKAYRSTGAQVAIADYGKLQQLFGWSPEESEKKLLQLALIVETQLAEHLIDKTNTTIAIEKESFVKTLRPPKYGRTIWTSVEPNYLDSQTTSDELDPNIESHFHPDSQIVELKGAGARLPKPHALADHQNGLLSLGEALREFHYEKLTEVVIEHSKLPTSTVSSLAVIALNFSAIYRFGSRFPAAILVRESSLRGLQNTTSSGYFKKIEELDNSTLDEPKLENTFRDYGLTASGWQFYGFRTVNVQIDEDFRLVDFGHYQVQERFYLPALPGAPGAGAIDQFTTANPKKQIPYKTWGKTKLGQAMGDFPTADIPSLHSFYLADQFFENQIDGQVFQLHHCALLMPFVQKLGWEKATTLPQLIGDKFTSLQACPNLDFQEFTNSLPSPDQILRGLITRPLNRIHQ